MKREIWLIIELGVPIAIGVVYVAYWIADLLLLGAFHDDREHKG